MYTLLLFLSFPFFLCSYKQLRPKYVQLHSLHNNKESAAANREVLRQWGHVTCVVDTERPHFRSCDQFKPHVTSCCWSPSGVKSAHCTATVRHGRTRRTTKTAISASGSHLIGTIEQSNIRTVQDELSIEVTRWWWMVGRASKAFLF